MNPPPDSQGFDLEQGFQPPGGDLAIELNLAGGRWLFRKNELMAACRLELLMTAGSS